METYIVFSGSTQDGSNIYYQIDDIALVDTKKSVSELSLQRRSFDKKMFKHASIGAIMPCQMDEKTITYKKDAIPVRFWLNHEDKFKWQTEQRVVNAYIKGKKLNDQYELENRLTGITNLYKTISPALRPALLAEVVKIIVRGN
jgi:hypothetical protein